ncbi:hypothetical protein [Advenella kashmirensis]|nr:hypothetical protein [Advenella kashmirensis]
MNTPERTKTGKFIKWLFIIFNIVMVCWVLAAMGTFGSVDTTSQAKALPHGTENSEEIGVSMIVMIWLICNGILGVLVLDTRARKRSLHESNKNVEE